MEAAEQTYTEVASLLGLEAEVERNSRLLEPRLPGVGGREGETLPGKLVVLLHQRRHRGPSR